MPPSSTHSDIATIDQCETVARAEDEESAFAKGLAATRRRSSRQRAICFLQGSVHQDGGIERKAAGAGGEVGTAKQSASQPEQISVIVHRLRAQHVNAAVV